MSTDPDPRRVLIVGAGRRVRSAVLPVLSCMKDRFRLAGMLARRRRVLGGGGQRYLVERLEDLEGKLLATCSLVIVAVSKDSVPVVLRRLRRHDVSRLDLLIDTPVFRFRDLGSLRLLKGFRRVWVAEDCARFPWIDTVLAAAGEGGPLGALREVRFEQSAWHYHGHATAKALLGGGPVVRARRRRARDAQGLPSPDAARVELHLAGGRRATIVEPRDYEVGRVVVIGSRGSVTDCPRPGEPHLALEPVVEGEQCSGFRIGDIVTKLDEDETWVLGSWSAGKGIRTAGSASGRTASNRTASEAIPSRRSPSGSITSRMVSLKRAGFLRLLRSIDQGHGAYPLTQGLEDMLADHLLQKTGHYLRTPLTSLESPVGRGFWGVAMRPFGGSRRHPGF